MAENICIIILTIVGILSMFSMAFVFIKVILGTVQSSQEKKDK